MKKSHEDIKLIRITYLSLYENIDKVDLINNPEHLEELCEKIKTTLNI
ncbi:MAG: hypothetical protein ACLTDP_10325 [Terrisporobacter sp.]